MPSSDFCPAAPRWGRSSPFPWCWPGSESSGSPAGGGAPEALPAERFDQFMARANAAYYATHDFSVDFCTAPELTQVFGELLGAWAKTVWQTMGTPEGAILA